LPATAAAAELLPPALVDNDAPGSPELVAIHDHHVTCNAEQLTCSAEPAACSAVQNQRVG
jgi:hypothetical protein